MLELSLAHAKQKLLSELKGLGIEASEAQRETELIIFEVTGLSLAQQVLEERRLITTHEETKLADILAKRKQRMPLQYCLGYTHFMKTKLTIFPGVFIPRSDTETVVTTAAKLLSHTASPSIAEIGIGSGAISIALLIELPAAQIKAVDLSPEAIDLSRLNAMQNGVIDRLTLIAGDWRENLPMGLDAIISNPPYIPRSQKDSLAPEVVNFEPELALFGDDPDGLSFYRAFIKIAPNHLKDDGLVVLEFGDRQDNALHQMFIDAGWRGVVIHKDMSARPRVISAVRPIKSP